MKKTWARPLCRLIDLLHSCRRKQPADKEWIDHHQPIHCLSLDSQHFCIKCHSFRAIASERMPHISPMTSFLLFWSDVSLKHWTHKELLKSYPIIISLYFCSSRWLRFILTSEYFIKPDEQILLSVDDASCFPKTMFQTMIRELLMEETEKEITFVSNTAKSALTSMRFILNTVAFNVD